MSIRAMCVGHEYPTRAPDADHRDRPTRRVDVQGIKIGTEISKEVLALTPDPALGRGGAAKDRSGNRASGCALKKRSV